MKVVISGDRGWASDAHITAVFEVMSRFPKDTTVIVGGANGVDQIAEAIAHELGFEVIKHIADWARYGPAAGPIRNTKMLKENPDLVVCFHDDLDTSKGTRDMYHRAEKSGVKTEVVASYDHESMWTDYSFKVRDRRTGKFLTKPSGPTWSKTGKTWATLGQLKSALKAFTGYTGHKKVQIPENWELVVMKALPKTINLDMMIASDFKQDDILELVEEDSS